MLAPASSPSQIAAPLLYLSPSESITTNTGMAASLSALAELCQVSSQEWHSWIIGCLRSLHPHFHWGLTDLHYSAVCKCHSCHHLLLFDFLRTAILTGVKLNECQCSFDLLCPTAKDNEQFFTYLLGFRTSFENCLLTYYAHFLMDYLFWCLTFWVLCRFWILIRWIAGRFPLILEALFILGSSFLYYAILFVKS